MKRIMITVGPWAVALGLHGAVAAIAALVIIESSAGLPAVERPADGVYSVDLRPGGETAAIAEAPRGDARVYTSIEPASVPIEGTIAEIPDLKFAPAPFELSAAKSAPGNPSRRGGHDRLPAASAEGEGRGSGAPGINAPLGPGRGTGSGGGDGTASAVPAVVLESPAPRYPDAARRRSIEGVATVRFTVRADGEVENARIVRSSGSLVLDVASVEAVRTWRYQPATLAGRPVSSEVTYRFIFRLE